MNSITLLTQLFLLAIFLSVNNFTASVGMGFSRIWSAMRWKIAITFGLVDFLAPIAGLYIENFVAGIFGQIMSMIGVAVIFLLGLYLIYDGWIKHSGREREPEERNGYHAFIDRAMTSIWAIVVIAFGVSLDNFIVGFSLGTFETPIILVAIVFGIVTFLMTSLGLVIGNKMRTETEEKIRNFAGKGRIITGIVFAVIALWKFFELV